MVTKEQARQNFINKVIKENNKARIENDAKYPSYTPIQTCFHHELIGGKWKLVPSI